MRNSCKTTKNVIRNIAHVIKTCTEHNCIKNLCIKKYRMFEFVHFTNFFRIRGM